ncbi:BON domain-containing protein, partial [Cupriavidus sp. CER94]
MVWIVAIAFAALFIVATKIVHAQSLRNYGNDPFVRVSSAVSGCPEPAGPRISEDDWKREAHHRIEEGNHCYAEGRCRLANAYQYDAEIAESLQRRL